MDSKLKTAAPAKPAVQPPQPEAKEDGEGAAMGFFDHLFELRKYLVRAVLGLVVTTTFSLIFADRILAYLIQPFGDKVQILGPTEGVVVFFRVALLAGAILSIPWITYQLWMFIAPGLTRKERRWVLMSIPATTLLFLIGVAFSWFILSPAALNFLSTFQADIFEVGWTADQYIAFVTSLLFWIGLSFETPLIFYILSRLGFVTPKSLRNNWRIAIVGAAVVAAMITPTIDPFNMMLVMGPLLTLYVLSIFLSGIGMRQGGFAD
ncbi:MAG: twin-arginine translocase subunit TatC [Anaerolineae bacterium]|nr:twin-arginine translocase subunit TatC [Anaerolineae bacterium]